MFQAERISIKPIKNKKFSQEKEKINGVVIAFIIISLWAINLSFLLSINISKIPVFGIAIAILLQTFLYTGLFITTHDAIHGLVLPKNHQINDLIGSVSALAYGLFSYKNLVKKHWLHHHHPASELDPDFHDTRHKNFFAWYFHFMKGYWSWRRLLGLILIFNFLKCFIHVAESNLILFWVIPPILSSLQLFYFGTFLTHREPEGGYTNSHFAQSTALPVFWSFITCYHFGYHQEHHEYPQVSWWKLPEVYKRNTSPSSEIPLR